MITIDWLTVASRMPSVVLDRAIHLYGIPCLSKIVGTARQLAHAKQPADRCAVGSVTVAVTSR
jgi:hypothetical protein